MMCRACDGEVQPVVDLGPQPAQAVFPRPSDPMPSPMPLRLGSCTACGLAQLAEPGAPEVDDPDAPSPLASPTMEAHARAFVDDLVARNLVPPSGRSLSLASHGGYLAPFIRERGGSAVIAEPDGARATRLAQAGEAVIRASIDGPAGDPIPAVGTFDLIVDSYLLAHLAHPRAALARLVALVAPGGTLAIEFDDLLATVIGGQWDAIGHGHPTYLSLGWLAAELARLGFSIIDAVPQRVYGGAMRVYARAGVAAGPSVAWLLAREAEARIGSPAGLAPLARAVERAGVDVVHHLRAERDAGRVVVGYGAPARSVTFLNALGIGPVLLPYVVDRAPAKQGRVVPGVRIPIRNPDTLLEDQPDEVLILTWNLADEVVRALAPVLPRTRFVVAIPTFADVTGLAELAPGRPGPEGVR